MEPERECVLPEEEKEQGLGDEEEVCCLIQKALSPFAFRFTFEKQRHMTCVGDRNQGRFWMQGLSSLTHLNHACLSPAKVFYIL